MSAFAVTRASVVAPAAASTSTSRRSVRAFAGDVKNAGEVADSPVVFYTDANGDAKRGTQAEYMKAKEEGGTYRASTVTGALPEWAAGATADTDVQYGLAEAFAFSAPAGTNFLASGPELMNSRLAMIGFVAAIGCELTTQQTVVQQAAHAPVGVALTVVLVVAGSLASYCANIEPPAAGPFKKEKELLNGRVAMIGMACLLGFEALNGHPLL